MNQFKGDASTKKLWCDDTIATFNRYVQNRRLTEAAVLISEFEQALGHAPSKEELILLKDALFNIATAQLLADDRAGLDDSLQRLYHWEEKNMLIFRRAREAVGDYVKLAAQREYKID